MVKLKHVIPTKEYEKQAIEYVREFFSCGSKINGMGGLDIYLDDYDAWLLKLKNDSLGLNIKKIPIKTFFLVREEDNYIVGMINIRVSDDVDVLNYAGHIGYSIRPTERNNGYNKINLYLGLKYLDKHNIKEALISCVDSNLASAKTIIALGGIKYEEIYKEEYGGNIQKYKIDIKESLNKYKKVFDNYLAD